MNHKSDSASEYPPVDTCLPLSPECTTARDPDLSHSTTNKSPRENKRSQFQSSTTISSRIRILHVDDDPCILEISRLFLEQLGNFTVVTESDPLRVADKDILGFDVIVSDYEMPDMNGLELLTHLRDKKITTPFILLTGRGNDTVILKSLSCGAASYLQKTANPRAMFTELAAVIKKEVRLRDITSGRAEAEPAVSSGLLLSLFDHIPDPAFAVDSEGRVIAWNIALADMTGFEAGTMLGEDWHRYSVILGGSARPLAVDALIRRDTSVLGGYELTLCTDSLISGKRKILLPDGSARTYWEKAALIPDPSGSPAGAVAIIRDLTRRSSRINQNQVTRDQLAAIADCMFSFGNDFRENIHAVLSLARRYCGAEAVGYLPGEADLPEVFSMTRDLERFSKISQIHTIIRRTGVNPPDGFSNWFTRHNDVIPTIAGRIVLLYGIEGETASGSSFVRLLTGVVSTEERRHLARLEVLRSEERYRILFDHAPVAIFEHDYSGVMRRLEEMVGSVEDEGLRQFDHAMIHTLKEEIQFLGMNHASCSLLGITSSSPLLQTNKPFGAEVSDLFFLEAYRCMKENKTGFCITEQIKLPDGQQRDVLVNWQMADQMDQYRSVLVSMVDITNEKRVEEGLIQANKKLNTLTMVTRHDILNLMTALIGYIGFIRAETRETGINRYCETSLEICDRITDIINFTRDYEQIGQSKPRWSPIHSLIQSVTLEKGFPMIRIIITLPPVTIFADTMFPMVIWNLVDNAVRHGGDLTGIMISGVPGPGGILELTVADDGVGVTSSEKEKIFHRGYGKNSGLGLFLVREILALTGIAICECGTEGEGARFLIQIPAESWRDEQPGYHQH